MVHVAIDNIARNIIYDVTNGLGKQHLCKVEALVYNLS